MPSKVLMRAPLSAHRAAHGSTPSLLKGILAGSRRFAAGLLICAIATQGVLADTITYQQLRQETAGRTSPVASTPTVARTGDPNPPGQTPQQGSAQAPVAKESPAPPEFVRLPDGRIVRYGPGVLCDENCVEPVTPAAFREPGPRWWWIVPPIVAGGILCAILCRPGRDSEPQPTPTIIIPPPSPLSSPGVTPTVAATISPGPTGTPPAEVPEPGTIILVGTGLAALLARKRKKAKQEQD
jgi:PEP-CTERM motif